MDTRKKIAVSIFLVIVSVLAMFLPMAKNVRAAIPVPHNMYGHAYDWNGVRLPNGTLITSWIDGTPYASNLTFYDWLDPVAANRSGKFDIDTPGNQITEVGNPDTPWIKEGGNESEDNITYVMGDMTGMDANTTTYIFENTTVWHTFVAENIDLWVADIQPPAYPKINNIVTQPSDLGNQYIYIYGPPGTDMSQFYIDSDDAGDTPVSLSGNIAETGYFYVELSPSFTLNIFGDEIKLVWRNPGGPNTPFGGMDVVVDRVEYNATTGGTLTTEPDNTIMPDAPAPAPGFDIRRQPTAGSDTNDCSVDFIAGPELGRPPLPPDGLTVEYFPAGSPGANHTTNRVNPRFDWNFRDALGEFQFAFQVQVANDTSYTDIRWDQTNLTSDEFTRYGGLPLDVGTDYCWRVRTRDALTWGGWGNMCFHTNTPPPVPGLPIVPFNGQLDVYPGTNHTEWNPNGSDAEGDVVSWEYQISLYPGMTPMLYSGVVATNRSNDHDFAPETDFYWQVRAYDAWEYSEWSNGSNPWFFHTRAGATVPEARFLAVEGFMISPEITHITNLVNPLLNWTFYDIRPTDFQTAYEVQVGTASGWNVGTIWSHIGGSENNVSYAGPVLSRCTTYYFRVEVTDNEVPSQTSGPTELPFHINCLPGTPTPFQPTNNSANVNPSATQTVNWPPAVSDDDGDSITYYIQVDDSLPFVPPYIINAAVDSLVSPSFVTTCGMSYYWHVQAYDGWETSPWSVWFVFSTIPCNERPNPPENLAVDGYTSPPEITHIINHTPDLNWTFTDPDPGDTQGAYDVQVWDSIPGTGNLMWDSNQTGSLQTVTYSGLALVDGQDYYFRVKTRDSAGLWSDWSAYLLFHMNAIPPIPANSLPADGSILTPSALQTISWSSVTDPDGDTVQYYYEVDNVSTSFTSIIANNTVSGNTSDAFQTFAGKCYYWHVRATDGWEDSSFNQTWSFCADNPPNDPTYLAVEGFYAAPNITHILTFIPQLNWTFSDPDGDAQAGFAVEVWTGSGGTGTQMWKTGNLTGSQTAVTYGYFGTYIPLSEGHDYYFRVRTKDVYLWSGWSELMFHTNAKPPAPTLSTPVYQATGIPTDTKLNWTEVSDPDGDSVKYWWYISETSDVSPPYVDNNTTSGTLSPALSLSKGTQYYWKVCAGDGWDDPVCSDISSFTTVQNVNPTALISAPAEANEGEEVTFDGTGSTDPDGSIVSYAWTFGDDGSGSGSTTTHTYDKDGTYTVTLTVTDDDGGTGTDSRTITIKAVAGPGPSIGDYWWVILIIVIIIVIAIVLLLAKRKKPEEEEAIPPPPEEEEVEEEAPEEVEEAPPEEEKKPETKVCPNCGTILAADDTECFMCGAKV